MSCMSWMSPAQRAALAASSAADGEGAPLSSFASPPTSDGKTQRVRVLAASADPAIRESAALSLRAPEDVLVALAADEAVTVRRCAARNERLPVALLRSLAADPDAVVRGWVAAHPAVPVDVREELASDEDARVRAVVGWAERWD